MILVRIIIAGSLVAHSLLGCCWHHAHASETESISHVHRANDDLPNNHLPSVGDPRDNADHQHGCLTVRCVVIRNKLAGTWLMTVATEWMSISNSPFCPAIPSASVRSLLDADEALFSPPVHRLHRVLLI